MPSDVSLLAFVKAGLNFFFFFKFQWYSDGCSNPNNVTLHFRSAWPGQKGSLVAIASRN